MTRVLSLLMLFCGALAAADFHVAPTGDDASPGTQARPFRTLTRARDAVRATPNRGGSTVWLHDGAWELTAPLELDARDSGRDGAPVLWRAVNPGRVRLRGGRDLPGQGQSVTDAAVLKRLDPSARATVRMFDLAALGIGNLGRMSARGFRRPYTNPGLELFCDDRALEIARWPNDGTQLIGAVKDKGSVPRDGDYAERGGTFGYDGDRPERWLAADDVWLSGLFNYGYADDTIKLAKIDPAAKTLTMAQATMYGIATGAPWRHWYALNLLEEIDRPGEYYVDRTAGKLYVWPPVGAGTYSVSLLDAPLVCLEGASYVTLAGLTIELGRGLGVYIERGESCILAGCTIRNFGTVGVCIGQGIEPDKIYRHEMPDGQPISRALGSWHEYIYAHSTLDRRAGRNHQVLSCDLYGLGAGAISLGGGDRVTLTPAGNAVRNCHLHDFNRLERTYRGAVNLDGVGNEVSGCLIHDAPGLALYLHGNDHRVTRNEIHHTLLVADDMGVFYMGRDPSEAGNEVTSNFFWANGSPLGVSSLIYCDDGASGTLVRGNVFWRNRAMPFAINGGRLHRIEGNLLYEQNGLHIPAGLDRAGWADYIKDPLQIKRLRGDIDVTKPPYDTRYPWLLDLWAPTDQIVTGSDVLRNARWRSAGSFETARNRAADNTTLDAPPAFVHDDRLTFETREPLGACPPIPFDTIGLQRDAYRLTLPLAEPALFPAEGGLLPGQAVVIRPRWADQRIVCTVDGSEPTAASPAYAAPLRLTAPTTVKARAVRDGQLGPVASGRYTPLVLSDPMRATPDGWLRAAQISENHGVEIDPAGPMGHIENGDHLGFGPFELGAERFRTLVLRVGIDPNFAGGRLSVRLDSPTGPEVGRHTFTSTGGFRVFAEQSVPLKGATGQRLVYLTFSGGVGIANIEALRFAE
ncbi:MAG: right-handed parallel beta-helix repeat-containing protein [Armatimonadetes bacterium]|nr:right-handed parallel beta-helix repeat-containing protein [Armatimonadota bacterium]